MNKAKFWRKWQTGLFVIFLIWGSAGKVYAAAQCSLLQILTQEKEIVSYIECESSIDSVDAQAAQYPCENVEIIPLQDISIHTIIMLDNSLSISEENRENIKNILRQYVREAPPNEAISFALFGEDIQFLTEKSQDTEEIAGLIDEIEFHNQDTFLTDFLFQAVEKIENDPEYTRFIVISDGVDNKAIGITKEELTSRLKETPRPIYTIGHVYKDNSEELKNMFALSRVTGGKELLIEDFPDISLITKEIHDFSHIYSVRMDVPESVMDGGSRHILMNIHTDEGDAEVTGQVTMPFTLAEEEPEAEAEPSLAPTPVPTAEPTPEPTPGPTPVPASKPAGIGADKIAGVLILIIAVIVLIFYQRRNKNKGEPNSKKSKTITPANPAAPQIIPQSGLDDDPTMIIGGRYLLVLRDRANPQRIFRYPLDGHIIVGRNIDMVQIPVDYSLTVSGQHCEFYIKGNRFFIRDMNSANHTYLEGRMISGETEIISGNIVRLGEVEFSVEIMPI